MKKMKTSLLTSGFLASRSLVGACSLAGMLALVGTVASGCATAPAPRPSTQLRVEGSVPDATVWVDDHLVGTLADLMRRGMLPLPPGYHRVEIRHPSYYSLYKDFDQAGGQEVAWHVELHPILD